MSDHFGPTDLKLGQPVLTKSGGKAWVHKIVGQQIKPEITIPPWLPPIFLDACGDHRQFDTASPFAKRVHLWATDGTILIRHRLSGEEYAELPEHWTRKKRHVPNVLKIWEQFAFTQNHPWCITLPLGNYEPAECPKCGGVGAYMAFCDCEECDGEGMIESCFRVTIGDTRTAVLLSRYVGLLLRHRVTFVTASTPQQPVYFAGNGFEGLLMTCTEAKP